MPKLLITTIQYKERGPFLFTGIFQNDRLLEADLSDTARDSLVGNIYVARVLKVQASIHGAFVRLADKTKAFLPTRDIDKALFVKKLSEKPIVQDELLVVQVKKDAHGDKDAMVSPVVSLSESLKTKAAHAAEGSLLSAAPPYYEKLLASLPEDAFSEILTDDPQLYEKLHAVFPQARLYTDSYGLDKLYAIEVQLEKALHKKIYLPSGGNLVIEQTEMCVCIDVNSSRQDAKKDKQEFLLQLNLEAAKEIAFQLRLRNLSGMILIDFVHMTDEAGKSTLIHAVKSLIKDDRIRTEYVDMTGLGLMELTRKRIRRTLAEQIFSD